MGSELIGESELGGCVHKTVIESQQLRHKAPLNRHFQFLPSGQRLAVSKGKTKRYSFVPAGIIYLYMDKDNSALHFKYWALGSCTLIFLINEQFLPPHESNWQNISITQQYYKLQTQDGGK